MAQQVEVAVVGEIAQGVGVAFGPVVQPQHTVGGEGVGHPHLQGAGEALIPVRAHVGEHQGAVHLPGLPYRLVEAPDAAVEAVGPAVGGQGIGLSVQLKGGPADAVSHPPHQGPEVLVLLLIVLQGLTAQDDVPAAAGGGDGEGTEDAAVGEHLGGIAPRPERPDVHQAPVRCGPEGGFRHFRHGLHLP